MGTTETLAKWIVETSYEDIPPAAYEQAKKSILDVLGTTILGSTTDIGQLIIGHTQEEGGNPQARVIATDIKTTSANAAFANGTMGHADDFDDLGGIGGHPAIVLTPPSLALGEQHHFSGRDVLTAWAVGYEVGTRLSVNLHPDRDWHPTAIFGTMASAVAASKLLGLDVHKTRMAMGIAGSEAAGLRRNFGTMTKPFHPGNASRSGVVAAKLAAMGYTADPDIIEGRQGYADNFGGIKCNLPAVSQFLGDFYYLASQGTRIKPWPCCGGNHRTLTGLLDLIQRYEINPDNIDYIEHVGADAPCTGALLRDEVQLGLEGKFCLRYNISAAVIDRKIDLSTFTDERAERDDVQQFMEKVRLVQNPDVLLRKEHIADGNMDASVRVHMLDGSEHNVELGAAMHLTGDAVVDKFQANASFVFGEDRLAEPVRLVQNLEELDDVSRLMDAVTIGS
ncbi:MAG: MmgE/PrpD family protein [SAR202 cluster bacterium]|jgi:2-methylcitrate dehydratase PrpD|nr:MmgE/PrpD family protein [SAR202 cluster bacterium]MDP6714243.1 MmgE/PrpD family protein [SAR202 cluster bacterium]